MVPVEWLSVALIHLLSIVALILWRAAALLAHDGPGENTTSYASKLDDDAKTPRRQSSSAAPLDRERAHALLFGGKMIATVWRWLERRGVPVRDRPDVSQDVFLKAHRSFHTYDPLRARPERWLNKIAARAAADYRYRVFRRREELTSEDPPDAIDETPGPEELLRMEEARLLVLELLHGLDIHLRAVLIAHDIDGIPMTEVAEQQGIPVSTAYTLRRRALAAFAAELKRHQQKREERSDAPRLV